MPARSRHGSRRASRGRRSRARACRRGSGSAPRRTRTVVIAAPPRPGCRGPRAPRRGLDAGPDDHAVLGREDPAQRARLVLLVRGQVVEDRLERVGQRRRRQVERVEQARDPGRPIGRRDAELRRRWRTPRGARRPRPRRGAGRCSRRVASTAWPTEWPRFRVIRPPDGSRSRSSAMTTSTFAQAQRSTSSATSPAVRDRSVARRPQLGPVPSRAGRTGGHRRVPPSSPPRRGRPVAGVRAGSPSAATSTIVANGRWKAPTRFLPSGRSTPVLPPIDESIWATIVVGTWMSGTPRRYVAASEPGRIAERAAADGDERLGPLDPEPDEVARRAFDDRQPLGVLALRQEDRLDRPAAGAQRRRDAEPEGLPRAGLGEQDGPAGLELGQGRRRVRPRRSRRR